MRAKLRAADLSGVERQVRIERYILRLERCDAKAIVAENPAQRGYEQALAYR
jgi:hypothetical protein